MKGRKLRPEEQALWESVARGTTPLDPPAKTAQVTKNTAKTKTVARASSPSEPNAKALAPFEMNGAQNGTRSASRLNVTTAPNLSEALRSAPVNMDFKTYKRMSRGKLSPEARIDLHGMTLARAQPALSGFLFSSFGRGLRLVLVITGKGRTARDPLLDTAPMPQRLGALRHEVPMWVSRPPLSQIVQQITPANARHGGEGAYYVYLRRR